MMVVLPIVIYFNNGESEPFDCNQSCCSLVVQTVTDVNGNTSPVRQWTVEGGENRKPFVLTLRYFWMRMAPFSITGEDVDGGSSLCGAIDLSVDPSEFDCDMSVPIP